MKKFNFQTVSGTAYMLNSNTPVDTFNLVIKNKVTRNLKKIDLSNYKAIKLSELVATANPHIVDLKIYGEIVPNKNMPETFQDGIPLEYPQVTISTTDTTGKTQNIELVKYIDSLCIDYYLEHNVDLYPVYEPDSKTFYIVTTT